MYMLLNMLLNPCLESVTTMLDMIYASMEVVKRM